MAKAKKVSRGPSNKRGSYRASFKLAPCNTLPAEILSMIFENTIASCETPQQVWLQPLHLYQVCRHWRAAMESSTKCWTNIVFSLSNSRDGSIEIARVNSTSDRTVTDENENGLRLAKYYLSKTGNTRRLHFTLLPSLDTNVHRRSRVEARRLRRFADECRPWFNRAESINFTVADMFAANGITIMMQEWSLPYLQDLSLVCIDPYSVSNLSVFSAQDILHPPIPPRYMTKMPQLRSITLTMPNFFRIEYFEQLTQVESLRLLGFGNDQQVTYLPLQILDHLKQMPNLKHLELSGILFNDPARVLNPGNPPFPGDKRVLPQLETLTVQKLSGHFLFHFFDNLDAPLLHTITMGHTDYYDRTVSTFQIITQCGRFSALKTLHLHNICYSLFQSSLRYFDWVETLSLKGVCRCTCPRQHAGGYDDGVFQPALENLWIGEFLCPKLTDLTIEVHGVRHARAVRAMLRDRFMENVWRPPVRPNPPKKVEKLTVTNCECHGPLLEKYVHGFGQYCDHVTPPDKVVTCREEEKRVKKEFKEHQRRGVWWVLPIVTLAHSLKLALPWM